MFTQKLQLLAFKNHGNFALEIPQTCFFACKLQPKQTLNRLKAEDKRKKGTKLSIDGFLN